jgi:hypothetical protein
VRKRYCSPVTSALVVRLPAKTQARSERAPSEMRHVFGLTVVVLA